MAASIDHIDLTELDELAAQCYQNSLEHGFYEDMKYHPSIEAMRSYWGNKFTLIHGEISEAHEELRSGHTLDEVYENEDKPGKPEGVTVEVIDAIIRSLDFLGYVQGRYGLKPSEIFARKFNYNVSRPAMHGRKF